MAGVGAAIYEALTQDTAVADILGANVFPPGGVPQTVLVDGEEVPLSPPWAEYQVNANVADKDLAGNIRGRDAEVTVSLITATYEDCQALQEAVEEALEGMTGTLGGLTIDGVAVTDSSDEPNGPIDRDEQEVYQADVTVGISYRSE